MILSRQPELDSEGRPTIDWSQTPAPTVDDSPASAGPSDEEKDEKAIEQFNDTVRRFISSLEGIHDLLLIRANRGETATRSLQNILDRLQTLTREDAGNNQQEYEMYVEYALFIEEVALLALDSRLLGASSVHMAAINYLVSQYNERQGIPEPELTE
jgi:hypothetical protein